MTEQTRVEACQECGESDEATYSEPTRSRMLARQLCFMCLYWNDLVDSKDKPNYLRIERTHYVVETDQGPSSGRGFGGRKFHIRTRDGREIVTRNLWHQGPIPERFQSRLPDNAEFVREA